MSKKKKQENLLEEIFNNITGASVYCYSEIKKFYSSYFQNMPSTEILFHSVYLFIFLIDFFSCKKMKQKGRNHFIDSLVYYTFLMMPLKLLKLQVPADNPLAITESLGQDYNKFLKHYLNHVKNSLIPIFSHEEESLLWEFSKDVANLLHIPVNNKFISECIEIYSETISRINIEKIINDASKIF